MKDCDFSYRHYKEIISLAKKKRYVFSDFFEKQGAEKRIYLRHDVDISLDNALKMAKIEKKERIKSTYLILLDSPYYNIFHQKYKRIIREISRLGHDIGIHYNGQTGSKEKIAGNLMEQYRFLVSLSFPIKKIVSFHQPSKKTLGETFPKFINAYEPDFFGKGKYISDSNREWKEGCACKFLEKSSGHNLQILTHPVWWNEKNFLYRDIYRKLKKERIKDIKMGLRSDISAYKNLFQNL